jgi:hypothetical protein
MATVHLPRNCTLHALSQEIGAAGALGSDWDALVVHFPAGCFVYCSAMAFLGTWGHQQVLAGRRMLLRGDEDALRYLARMDLNEHLGVAYDASRRQSEVGRFLPLRLIAGDADVLGTVNAICDLVLHQFENAREFIPALTKAPKGTPQRHKGTKGHRETSVLHPSFVSLCLHGDLVGSQTGVMFSLDTRKPVDLTQTWIAGGDWSYIDAEAERIGQAGGIRVVDECINIGTRPPAQRLRRKVQSLLPEMSGPLLLDFTGVQSATSSFLDELLGRLARSLGADDFHRRIQVVGMESLILHMANVVIAQRLEGLAQ